MKHFKPKRRDYFTDSKYSNTGKPPMGDDKVTSGLSIKALKDLPQSSVTFKTDPYTNVMPHSIPYNILNSFNRKVGGHYSGNANLDGGNVQQYASSTRSKFLRYADFLRLKVNLNYRYVPIRKLENQKGHGLVDEMLKAMAEASSLLGATTFTQLAVNNFAIETDMCMGSSQPVNITKGSSTTTTPGKAYTKLHQVLYAGLMFYQIFWQDVANSYTWHNSFRLKQGTMIRSAWNREVPNLNALFGLFNKKSFLNLLEGVALSFEGEYIDSAFISQSAMLNAMPSRRSNSITDPVLELQTKFNLPTTFRIWVTDATGTTIGEPIFDMQRDIPDFESAIDNFNDRLAAENIMSWARNSTLSTTSGNAYFNATKAELDKITACVVKVKESFSDFRECLDIMTRTGTVGWSKNFKPMVTQDTSADLYENMLINDIYQLVMAGATEVQFDNVTKRWRSFSLWNMYNGIPEYDSKQGGAFLTMSFKNLDFTVDDDDNHMFIPIAMTADEEDSTPCYCVARDGVQMTIEPVDYNMASDFILNRLVPLDSQSDLDIRVPELINDNELITDAHRSAMYKTLCQVFGLASVRRQNFDTSDTAIDPDIISIYQIEIEDFTNMAINYARSNAPFRASSRETSFLGFFGLSKS